MCPQVWEDTCAHWDLLCLLSPKSPWKEGRKPGSPELSHPPPSPQPVSVLAVCGDTCRSRAPADPLMDGEAQQLPPPTPTPHSVGAQLT